MDTTTTSAQPGGALDSRDNLLMAAGIKAGYFLALAHFTDAIEKRVKIQDEILEKLAGAMANPAQIEKVKARRLALWGVLHTLDNHHERITDCFDFSEGGIQ